MSKYDFEIDLSANSSTGMILSKLSPGSTVLEFGCAAGRMTRYMKEELGCRVYIVEYDEGAFRKAMEFAEDGICDDIQDYRWAERFAGVTFDAILFADVLEHLTRPEEVLKKAAAFLKEDGYVYVSIPNVTHNDIVLKMFAERFDYTQTGLLDDTHVHFWGLENLQTFGEDTGLFVKSIEGTHCAAGNTEQNVQLGENLLLENILRERRAGEIYQFVLTMDKRGVEEPVVTVGALDRKSHIYLDTGNDFNAVERIAVTASWSGAGSYHIHYVVENTENLCRVRLDPVESQGAILRRVSICQNGEEKTIVAPSAAQTAEGLYLPGDDPMVIVGVQPGQGPVTVDAEFLLPGVAYLRALEDAIFEEQALLDTTMQQSQHEIRSLQEAIQQERTQLTKEITNQRELLSQSEATCRQLQTDVCAYIVLVNQKEKISIRQEQQILAQEQHIWAQEQQICGLEQQNCCLQQQIRELEQRICQQEHHISENEKALAYYSNLRVVKLRMFAGRVLRKIKRVVKKLLGRISK